MLKLKWFEKIKMKMKKISNWEKYQLDLAQVIKSKFRSDDEISPEIMEAYYSTPRHLFVSRFRKGDSDQWINISQENLDRYLSTIYSDNPLILYGSRKDFSSKPGSCYVSTISQPSFVLYQINLLNLKLGHKVFELGTASGWNAALISKLIGLDGRVITYEIISDLVTQANINLKKNNISNVTVLHGDGGEGASQEAPFDRVIFTAGSYDLPQAFHQQLKTDGLCLFVLKCKSDCDYLLLLRKREGYFEAIKSIPCNYVSLTGKYSLPELDSFDFFEFIKNKITLNKVEIESVIKKILYEKIKNLSLKLKLFLSFFTEFVVLKDGFGWLDHETGSALFFNMSELICYGNEGALRKLLSIVDKWIQNGEPSLQELKLSIYPITVIIENDSKKLILKREQSQFIFEIL